MASSELEPTDPDAFAAFAISGKDTSVKERPAIAEPETRALLVPRATTQQAFFLFLSSSFFVPEELEEEVEVVWFLRRSS